MHDEQVHVPLVVRVPGLAPARHRAPTSTTYVLPWLLQRAAAPAREAANRVLANEIGPWIRELDGAVVSEMIGPRAQHAALVWADHTVVYDLFAELVRIYDTNTDQAQRYDLRESDPALLAHVAPLVQRYRRLRFAGQRFRFVPEPD